MNTELHKAQLHILETLRRSETQSFSQLMKPLDMQSDAFKFHVRKVCSLGLVTKTALGAYTLTPKGKEFANKLNRSQKSPRQQIKLSMLIIVSRVNSKGETEYLCQQRLRQPFYGFWGCISGPVLWGEDCEDAAKRELLKQTGLTASFEVKTMLRQRDYDEDNTLLEDKLFFVLRATQMSGDVSNVWAGGRNAWLTLPELEAKSHYFDAQRDVLRAVETSQTYLSRTAHYTPEEY